MAGFVESSWCPSALSFARVVLLLLPLAGAPPCAASSWVVINDFGNGVVEADHDSLVRDGPWVEFIRRWRAKQGNLISGSERTAVNCLTRSFGTLAVPPGPGEAGGWRRMMDREEIEQHAGHAFRISLERGKPTADRMARFACVCEAVKAVRPADEAGLRALYRKYVLPNPPAQQYHLRTLPNTRRETAQAALAELRAGKPFDEVFARYSTVLDRQNFPAGRLPDSTDIDWPVNDTRLFRSLHPGEAGIPAAEGIYGWSLYLLDEARPIPAPSFEEMKADLERYSEAANRCGWKP